MKLKDQDSSMLDDDIIITSVNDATKCVQKGPKIVVIGGGTGLSTVLKGIKEYSSNVTAIVTVTDDGGSSGRLKEDMGILPPGDIRNCIVALADKESLMERVLQYRFKNGDLAGHSFGNLFLAAISEVCGSFYEGVKVLSEILAIRGRVLPSTLQKAEIAAELINGERVFGECNISKSSKRIKRVFLVPRECSSLPEAIDAIREADIIALGPGSLYTSVISNLLVEGIADAIKKSKALKMYICNVMTQPGETDGYTAYDHLKAIVDHAGDIVDYIIVNTQRPPDSLLDKYNKKGADVVAVNSEELKQLGVELIERELILETDVVRHDPYKLAKAILEIWENKI